MTTGEFISIITAIVKAWPYDEYWRLNTVAVTEKKSDLSSDNFNRTEEDRRAGDYYTRDGSDVRSSGYVLIEHNMKSKDDLFSMYQRSQVWLTVAYDQECKNCDQNHSKRFIFEKAVKSMNMLLNQLESFKIFELDSESVFMNLRAYEVHPERESLIYVGEVNNRVQGESPIRISRQEMSAQGLIGCAVKIIIEEDCLYDVSVFDYTKPDVDGIPIVACESCG